MDQQKIIRKGSDIVIDQLMIQGVDRIFCASKDGYIITNDDLSDTEIHLLESQQAGNAGLMAEAYGRLTNQPGICLVQKSSELSSIIESIELAMRNATPMIVLVEENDQDVYLHAKCVMTMNHIERISEKFGRAFHLARSGRSGPVVILCAENLLNLSANVANSIPIVPVSISPSVNNMLQFEHLLNSASDPILILGGCHWDRESIQRIEYFAQRYSLPTAVQACHQMLFSNEHEAYVGNLGQDMNPELHQRIQKADLVVMLGGALIEHDRSNPLLSIPIPQQTLIHIDADINELNRVYQSDLTINADPKEFTHALLMLRIKNNWLDVLQRDRQNYIDWQSVKMGSQEDSIRLLDCIEWLNQHLVAESIVVNGIGEFSGLIHRYYHYRAFGSQLASVNSPIGFGLSAAIAAQNIYPNRRVVAFIGQNEWENSKEEYITALHYQLPIIVIVVGDIENMTKGSLSEVWEDIQLKLMNKQPAVIHCIH